MAKAAPRMTTKKSAPGPSTTRQARGAPVVARVLEVTIDHLARHGFANLSVPDVAAEAGLNKTSVYRRWPTKVDLVRDALAVSMGHSVTPPDTGDLREDMLLVARGALLFVESPQGMGVLRTLLAESANPEVRDLAASILASQETDAPRAIIQRAVARGDLPRDVDAQLVFRTIAGAILHRTFIEQEKVTSRFLEELVDLILDGARAAKRGRA